VKGEAKKPHDGRGKKQRRGTRRAWEKKTRGTEHTKKGGGANMARESVSIGEKVVGNGTTPTPPIPREKQSGTKGKTTKKKKAAREKGVQNVLHTSPISKMKGGGKRNGGRVQAH